jgi:hypothetical protein
MPITTLTEFPGFAVNFDQTKNPMFVLTVTETLRQIKKRPCGKRLLHLIGNAVPQYRPHGFPFTINVLIKPASDVEYYPDGFHVPSWKAGNPVRFPGLPKVVQSLNGTNVICKNFRAGQGCYNLATDQLHSENCTGCVCEVVFSNAIMLGSGGDHTRADITLAHELVHSYHCLYGQKLPNGTDEEQKTTGLGQWASTDYITENLYRSQAGVPERTRY